MIVYDVSGRQIRTLARGQFPAGFHTVTWDGQDESGHRVSSGLYFLRARGDGGSRELKMVVTR